MLSREFADVALLTAVFCLCGVLVPKRREMSLNRIRFGNQAVAMGVFRGRVLRKYVDGTECRQTEQRIGAKLARGDSERSVGCERRKHRM